MSISRHRINVCWSIENRKITNKFLKIWQRSKFGNNINQLNCIFKKSKQVKFKEYLIKMLKFEKQKFKKLKTFDYIFA
jgi:hypothetical protein